MRRSNLPDFLFLGSAGAGMLVASSADRIVGK